MRGYAATAIFTAEERLLLGEAERFVARLYDPDGEVRCHEVARAFQETWPEYRGIALEVVDGTFGIVDHSWIEAWNGPRKSVLDVYSVGRLPIVQLIHVNFKFPLPFNSGKPRDDVRRDVISQLRKEGWG